MKNINDSKEKKIKGIIDFRKIAKNLVSSLENISNTVFIHNSREFINERLTWDGNKNCFQKRTKNFILPKEVVGTISNLSVEEIEPYKNILRNSTQFDCNGKITRIGILNEQDLNNLEKANPKIIVNQIIAKHILGMDFREEHLKSIPFSIICKSLSEERFIEAYASGNLDNEIIEIIGHTYDQRRLAWVNMLKENQPRYKSKDQLKYEFGEVEGINLSSREKYNLFIKLMANTTQKNENSYIKTIQAIDLIEHGFYPKDISIHLFQTYLNGFLAENEIK